MTPITNSTELVEYSTNERAWHPMSSFSGRTAFITGGARGQGRTHALALAERGADIVLVDRCTDSASVAYPLATRSELDDTAKAVTDLGRRCLTVVADVADRTAMDDAVARAVDEFGRIDIAIANAGVSVAEGLTGLTEAMWNEVIGTNLTGVFNTVAAVAPVMAANGYGRIVTVSSMMGRSAAPGMAAYSASKWGVIGLSKSAALELAGTGVTVNVIAPGNISTPMVHNEPLYKRMRPDLEAPTRDDVAPVFASLHAQPVPFIEPEEVTRVVLFLADELTSHITGTVVPIDAGAAARVSS